jgi:hypothetical protein
MRAPVELDERIAAIDRRLIELIRRGAPITALRALRHERRRLVCAKRAQRRGVSSPRGPT